MIIQICLQHRIMHVAMLDTAGVSRMCPVNRCSGKSAAAAAAAVLLTLLSTTGGVEPRCGACARNSRRRWMLKAMK